MPLVKVGSKHQVVIPKIAREQLGVEPGDYVEISYGDNKAVLKRKKFVDNFPVTDEPLGSKAKAALRQGQADIEAGRVQGPFKSADDLIKQLKKRPSPGDKKKR